MTAAAPSRAGAPARFALHELAFPAMGTHVRLLASDPAPLPEARAEIERLAARLTRFDAAASSAPQRRPARGRAGLRGPAGAVRAALAGAERTGGLADPTLLGALERAGYDRTLTGRPRTPLRAAAGGGSRAAPRAGRIPPRRGAR